MVKIWKLEEKRGCWWWWQKEGREGKKDLMGPYLIFLGVWINIHEIKIMYKIRQSKKNF